MFSFIRYVFITILFIQVAATAPVFAGDELKNVVPEKAGFSAKRLAAVDALMTRLVSEKELNGVVTIISRHGKIIYQKAVGMRDQEAGLPMMQDTIFRIYSMTKPVIGTAMMILFEEGKWKLDDPIYKYIPQFRGLKVYSGDDGSGNPILKDPDHAPTMRELMTHTAGFTYGVIGDTPVDRMYREKGVLDPGSTLADMIHKLAEIPLLYQPGTRWVYSVSADIQGYLVEKLSGRSLPDFLQTRIFDPLNMRDTGFSVPQDKRNRFAKLYAFDEKTHSLHPASSEMFGVRDYTLPVSFPSGGAGLVSTARDYMRFCQMLLNGGSLGGARILAPGTVNLIRANHLPAGVTFAPGSGFGLDFAVTNDPVAAGTLAGKGTYFWGGAAGTWFWIDPENDIVYISMIQRIGAGGPGSPLDTRHLSTTALYQALVNPEK